METYALLESYLKTLRLPTVLRAYRPCAQEAAHANQSYERYLQALVEQEVQQREVQRQQRLIRAARFPVLKELAQFEFHRLPHLNKAQVLDLTQGQYLAQAEPVILVGNPGLGKTHVAIGLALEACRQGHRVRFHSAASLVNELVAAQAAHTIDKYIQQALNHRLIVLDELGFIPFSEQGSHLMFQFISALYERVALLITTNLRFAEWTQVFGSERLTAALLDRVTHRATILEFVGESYRFRERQERQASARAPDPVPVEPPAPPLE